MSKIVVRPKFNSRIGGLLPHDKEHTNSFLQKLRSTRRAKLDSILTQCVQEFKGFIEREGTIYAACNMMIDQANELYTAWNEEGLEHLKYYHEMCDMIDEAIQEPPLYNDTGLAAFPINAILDFTLSIPTLGQSYGTGVIICADRNRLSRSKQKVKVVVLGLQKRHLRRST